jgi:transcriptional regulator with XRE-family HTH domain
VSSSGEIDMTAFDRLKFLADRQGMSINDVESKIGLGTNTLYSWKKKVPSGTNLQKVAELFNVSVDYLLGRTDNPKVNTDDSLLAAHIADDVTEEEMEEIKQFIEFIKSKR